MILYVDVDRQKWPCTRGAHTLPCEHVPTVFFPRATSHTFAFTQSHFPGAYSECLRFDAKALEAKLLHSASRVP